ncbi:DEAD/DEAH box helicase [Anthocerotibacter panamensis]|uniref:DEAD/DEAH box helicase n=1 Tax=Anthocerotibacter panamensis TaxID=2857077 RepID=UPI001C407245|nr:DEAD/DEAH box helicase [Anthocerotibacter panamensis]
MTLSFQELGLNPELARTVTALGFETPTPIQLAAIPHLLAGRDVIGCARTGTGKTAAYTLPLLEKIDPTRNEVQLLVLTPTRELAVQVAEAIHTFSQGSGLQVLPVYGGQPIEKQTRRLQRGVQVVIGTPGRLLDHLERGVLRLDRVRALVLDECDEMLDMGFVEDVTRLMEATPTTRQSAFFSATMSPAVQNLSQRHLKNPVRVVLETKIEERTADIDQRACLVSGRRNKTQVLVRFLEIEAPTAVLIFTRTKQGADQLTDELAEAGYSANVYHGDLTQNAREMVIRKFRNRGLNLLVATDVAARGLDIEQITHVVNYDAPPAAQTYVHRIGRTGRAGRQGVAITLIEPAERRLLRFYERTVGQAIPIVKAPGPRDVQQAQRARLERTLREVLAQAEELPTDANQDLVERLAQEFDPLDIARATLSLLPGPTQRTAEIPVVAPPSRREGRPQEGENRFELRRTTEDQPMVRLYIGAGRDAGLRPGDIVGAIANEAGIPGRTIGAIEILDTHAFVEVREQDSVSVLNLKNTTLRGRQVAFELASSR